MADELELTHEEISSMGVVGAGFMGAKVKEPVTETKPEEVKTEVKAEEVKAEEPKAEEKKEEPKKLFSDAFKKKQMEASEVTAAEQIKGAKLEEVQAELTKLKAAETLRAKLDTENTAVNEIKTSLGDEWSPEVEAELAGLIESDYYDKFDKAGFTAQEKMLELTNIAMRKVGENGNKAVKEKIKEIKDTSKIDLKGDATPKPRTKADIEEDYKRTGDEKYMDEMMNLDNEAIRGFFGL